MAKERPSKGLSLFFSELVQTVLPAVRAGPVIPTAWTDQFCPSVGLSLFLLVLYRLIETHVAHPLKSLREVHSHGDRARHLHGQHLQADTGADKHLSPSVSETLEGCQTL
jgi:hypothetical protein